MFTRDPGLRSQPPVVCIAPCPIALLTAPACCPTAGCVGVRHVVVRMALRAARGRHAGGAGTGAVAVAAEATATASMARARATASTTTTGLMVTPSMKGVACGAAGAAAEAEAGAGGAAGAAGRLQAQTPLPLPQQLLALWRGCICMNDWYVMHKLQAGQTSRFSGYQRVVASRAGAAAAAAVFLG